MDKIFHKCSKTCAAVISELRKDLKVVLWVASCLLLLAIAFGCLYAVIGVTSENGEAQSEEENAENAAENALDSSESESTQSAQTLPTYVVVVNAIHDVPNIVVAGQNATIVTESHPENVESATESAKESVENAVKSDKSAMKSVENTEESATKNSENANSHSESAPESTFGVDDVKNAFNTSKSAIRNFAANAKEFKYFEKAGDIEKITVQDGSKSGYYSTCTAITMFEGTTVERNRRNDIRLRIREREVVELKVREERITIHLPTHNNQWKVFTMDVWRNSATFEYGGVVRQMQYREYVDFSNIARHLPNGTICYEKVSLHINATKDFVTVSNVAVNITIEKLHLIDKRVPLKLRRNSPTNKTTVIELSTDAIVYERRRTGLMNVVVYGETEEKIQISPSEFYIDLENERGNLHFAPNSRITVADRAGQQINASLIDRNLLHVEYVNGTVEMSFDNEFGQISANFTNNGSFLANMKNKSFSLKNAAGEMSLREGNYVDVNAHVDAHVHVNLQHKSVRVGQGKEVQLQADGWRGPDDTVVVMGGDGKVYGVGSHVGDFEDGLDSRKRRVLNITHANGYTSLYPAVIGSEFNGITFYNHPLDLVACCYSNVRVSKIDLRMVGAAGSAIVENGHATIESLYAKIIVEPFHFRPKMLDI